MCFSPTIATASLSACTSVPAGLAAGAPSGHTPQSYEKLSSTAAIISTLGGSALRGIVTAGSVSNLSTPEVTGSVNSGTRRIELNDGIYLFVDTDGPDSSGGINDSPRGASGATGPYTLNTDFSGYDYVTPYRLTYFSSGNSYMAVGVAGIITNASDMPVAGSATYNGVALAAISNYAPENYINDLYLDDGQSTVDVNFASGTATVNLGNFTRITDSFGAAVASAVAAINGLEGTGFVISGAHFSGGAWVTVKNGIPVNVAGAGQVSMGSGTFFGYDSSISAPDEVAGTVIIDGATANVIALYIAD